MKLRFAPSPTGYLHVGNARTLLMNWLYAKRYGAEFILRFDDTDVDRSDKKFIEQINNDLDWLRLDYSETYRQSDRTDLYHSVAQKLKSAGRLYACYETPQELDFKRKRLLSQGRPPLYDRAALQLTSQQRHALEQEGRKPHWRFKLEDHRQISWHDMAHGELCFDTENLSDPIVIRENGAYLFTLSGVIDDCDLGITHIIRGDDHISNTAIQLQILDALEENRPHAEKTRFTLGHLPLMTLLTGEGLSKRFNSLSLKQLREDGYEARAVKNYLAALGNPQVAFSDLSLEALAENFDLDAYGKSAPKFSLDDLRRTNAKILHDTPYENVQTHLAKLLRSENINASFWNVARANIELLNDIKEWDRICHRKVMPQINDKDYIETACAFFPEAPLDEGSWKAWTLTLKAETGKRGKDLFMPLRQALTGVDHGPEMARLLPLIDYERAKARLRGEIA